MDLPTELGRVCGGTVEYRLVPGDGTPVVVLHGGHMRAGLPLGETALVRAGHAMLVPSRPGYGRTPLIRERAGYGRAPATGTGPEGFARSVAELCAQLELPRVHVIGVSAGGPTAVALAATTPSLVRSLVLVSARSSLPFPAGPARHVARFAFNARTEGATWAAVRRLVRARPERGLRAMMGSLSTVAADRVVSDLSAPEQAVLADLFAGMRSGSGFLEDVRCGGDQALESAVAVPTLIVASPSDGSVGPEHAERLHRAICGSELWLSPSLSHLVWFGSGGPATDERIEEFLAGR